MIYIDLGSSTIKTYKYAENLNLLEEHSVYFKNGFTAEEGISAENIKELYTYFKILKEKYNLEYETTFIYATGIFRNLNDKQKIKLIKDFNNLFDLHINIISHGIENYYLGKAMENDYNNQKVMIINMGGKTTEIITFQNNEITNRLNLKIGVAELLNKFPLINESISKVSIKEINDFVKEELADITFDTDYACAIFTGEEERFEKLTNYNLVKNTLFDDKIHECMVSYDDYVKGTDVVFFKIKLEELYALMPNNPKWMDGARAGAILPLAIFDKADIKVIVPSDLNLINGVINDK
jgi:exopolyphosphatase/pppGpp-phosphohydrolase